MEHVMKTMDGNEAAAYSAYAFTEVATIYPITPSSPMAEHTDVWAANGKKNIFGQPVRLVEMQSEAGAAAAMQGSLETGALATSYTSSQGLLLMIPPMFRIAGQLHPGVLHVSARSVGTNTISIYGEHSDIYACRQTGFAMVASATVQEVMDLAGISHLSAIKGSVPFLHFFDGFRTSHELQKIEVVDYDIYKELVDKDAVRRFRKRSLNPERPIMRSGAGSTETYFQQREASNPYYDAIPDIVNDYMEKMGEKTGRHYQPFMYYGAEDAEEVIVAMGSVSGAVKETVDYLNAQGRKVGFMQVILYRPFSAKYFLSVLPKTVKKIAVLDRTKEPGALGEPLYLDVCSVINEANVHPQVIGGRYGLSIKDTTPAQIVAVFDELDKEEPKNHFTVGINDDLTFTSLPVGDEIQVTAPGTVSCKFWGLGSDGTVGANKNSIKIIGDHTDKYVQAYFEYDAKKSGGVTRSHLRFGDQPIIGSYLVKHADFVACHTQAYMEKYDIVNEVKPGGTFLLNCQWTPDELDEKLPAAVRKTIAERNIHFYIINAVKIGKEIGLGNRTNAVLQSAFFKLANIIPIDDAIHYMKEAIKKTYGKKGEKVVSMNEQAVDRGCNELVKIEVPESWKNLEIPQEAADENLPEYMRTIGNAMNHLRGDSLPVSAFKDSPDGTMPVGTSKYDKRGVAVDVPVWNPDKCIQCNQCSLVCPHAAIRPFLLTEEESKKAPAGFKQMDAKGKGMEGLKFAIQVDPLDCLGCGVCVNACPAKEKALEMSSLESQMPEAENWEYAMTLSTKKNPADKFSVKGSQFEQPLLEFSGACAGCGEAAYMKLATQLFGDRMIVANATGCTQAWGFVAPSLPYTTNGDGCGPALSNSLFENNAEFSLGMCLAVEQQRTHIKMDVEALAEKITDGALKEAAEKWLEAFDSNEESKPASRKLAAALADTQLEGEAQELKEAILAAKEHLSKKSMWMYGGDGWAYDIGYGGLDHVIATGEDVNILVVDTEVYSNTGGQASKATQKGAVAPFAASGKKMKKKDLGLMAMQYGYVYVAQVALGANPAQLLKVMKEAESYKGPSLIIAYAPCINHGVPGGMGCTQLEAKKAVESGYWYLYRFDPRRKEAGLNPFVLDSKEPNFQLKEFMMGEVRFAALTRTFKDEADRLLKEAEKDAKEKYMRYKKMADEQ